MAQPPPGQPVRNACNTSGKGQPCPPDTHPAVIPAGHSDSTDRDCCWTVPGFKFFLMILIELQGETRPCSRGRPCAQNQVSLGFINQYKPHKFQPLLKPSHFKTRLGTAAAELGKSLGWVFYTLPPKAS